MALPVQYTLTSRVLSADTQVSARDLSSDTSSLLATQDVLAHRQLAAAISYAPLHASLHSKSHVERILGVVNRRHRMAQMASRASVEFYVGLALKARGQRDGKEVEVREEAFVIRTFRNGLGVFVSKSVPSLLSRSSIWI